MFKRFVERRAEEALSDTPVVLIVGPRRAGKTTLVKKMGEAGRTYITLDDQTVLEAARSDPAGFIRGLDRAIIDEIQRAPDLLLAIKKTVDEDYRPGRFLLTGSANVLTLPRVADSLAGRMETLEMLPLARAEIEGRTPTFLDRLFEGKLQKPSKAIVGDDLVHSVLLGGFPEAIARESERRRQDWARSYLTSVLTRDLRDIAEVEKLTELPKFVRLLAEHSSQLVNYSQFGASINVSHKTGQRYVGLLEQVFLITTLQPWFTNALKRIVKTPKLHFLDSGLLASTRGLTFDRVKADRGTFGALLERAGAGGNGGFLDMAADIARHHHERWDGTGYPYGLKEEEIPLCARVTAVADVFDALTSARVYKDAMPVEEARQIILEGRGNHFDPDLVDAFEACYADFLSIKVDIDGALDEETAKRRFWRAFRTLGRWHDDLPPY